MKPRVAKIDPYNIDREALQRAAEVIHNRGLVAFPTETVYGLGANALDPRAVAKIFEAKKRPLDDPLIVHIAEAKTLHELAKDVPQEVNRLIERFWPGPLTIILKKSKIVPPIVTTGLDTVAVRMPSNEIARQFILAAGVPIAAPSANLFGRPSPTKASHVVNDLDGRIDMVLDGGSTEIGVESTVIEPVGGKVLVLRPGGVTLEELTSIVPNVKVSTGEELERSPGKYPQHYAPQATVVVIEDGPSQIEHTLSVVSEMTAQGKKTGVLAKQEHRDAYKNVDLKVLGPAGDSRICASRLFYILREFDSEGVDTIVAEGISEKGLGLAVMNRLRKAAGESYQPKAPEAPHF